MRPLLLLPLLLPRTLLTVCTLFCVKVWSISTWNEDEDRRNVRCYDEDLNDYSMVHPTEVDTWICENTEGSFALYPTITMTCGCSTPSPISATSSPAPVVSTPIPTATSSSAPVVSTPIPTIAAPVTDGDGGKRGRGMTRVHGLATKRTHVFCLLSSFGQPFNSVRFLVF